MRLGIFGGTFNPVHYGHLRVAEEARVKNDLDKVIFIPSGNPPIKISELADASARYLMTSLAVDSNPDFIVSDLEIRQIEKSYTVNTVERLREIYSDDELFLILGIDAFLDMPAWRQPEKITEIIDFIVVTRLGYNFSDVLSSPYIKSHQSFALAMLNAGLPFIGEHKIELQLLSGRSIIFTKITPIGISSTYIRGLVKKGESIKYLVPDKVEKFIHEYTLYGNQK